MLDVRTESSTASHTLFGFVGWIWFFVGRQQGGVEKYVVLLLCGRHWLVPLLVHQPTTAKSEVLTFSENHWKVSSALSDVFLSDASPILDKLWTAQVHIWSVLCSLCGLPVGSPWTDIYPNGHNAVPQIKHNPHMSAVWFTARSLFDPFIVLPHLSNLFILSGSMNRIKSVLCEGQTYCLCLAKWVVCNLAAGGFLICGRVWV